MDKSNTVDEKIFKLVTECRAFLQEKESRLLNRVSNNKASKDEVNEVLKRYLKSKKEDETIIDN